MANNAMEEFSVGQMLPVVPINSDQKGNSLSDTSIEIFSFCYIMKVNRAFCTVILNTL